MIFLSLSPWVCLFCYSCLCVYVCVRVQNVWTSKRCVQLSIQWAQQGVRALWPDSPTLWLSGFISDPQIMSSCCAVGTMDQHFKNHINYLSCLCAASENKVNIKTADMNRSCDGASSELWSIIPFFFDDRQNDGTLMARYLGWELWRDEIKILYRGNVLSSCYNVVSHLGLMTQGTWAVLDVYIFLVCTVIMCCACVPGFPLDCVWCSWDTKPGGCVRLATPEEKDHTHRQLIRTVGGAT